MRRFLFYNFHFVYNTDRWVRRHFTQAGLLVLGTLVASSVFSIDTRQTFAYQLFSVLFALLLFATLYSLFFRLHVVVKRELPRFATVGEPLHYRVSIENKTANPFMGLVLFENIHIALPSFTTFVSTQVPYQEKLNWFDNYIGYPRWIWLMAMSRGATIEPIVLPNCIPLAQIHADVSMIPLRRGYVHFTGMSFARTDPFGIFNGLYTAACPDTLLVLPKRYPVGNLYLSGSRRYQRGGVHLAMSVGDAEEFYALREYRAGDPLRHIHWKSLAKLSKPVVQEFQDEYYVRHALILDTFTTTKHTVLFEAAVTVAASITCAPRSHEILLDLMFVGLQTYHFSSGRGLAQTSDLLETLACVDICADKTIEHLLNLVKQQVNSFSGCVCILLQWDAGRQELVRFLQSLPIFSLVLLVSHEPVDIDPIAFPAVRVLLSHELAEGLATLPLSSKN
ncbi:DUF58 domain-containing protein [Beggiatoa leptomitoformis]|uniref:DUF58 domain-containing protein n=1 Tax=Beggiatoa leptomitoformis TaxID=288004 RepID=A0A2N9YE19_9GAMM|nr:DUF58 domain-containing protein [Beggiatoa leptomitoformis]ALG68896.1 DUF58 domain-containing protein [Beggiatoa leptomitoformis]AUI68730.1 DUF58 domain-containing protein [Beggiatoa leptomitoformis]